MSAERDAFRVEGGCWCPGTLRLEHLRLSGHTEECTNARRGWELNRRHMSEMDRRREEERALGSALLADARAALANKEEVA